MFFYHKVWKIKNLYIIFEKKTVLQRWNNACLSTLNQRQKSTLKQRWFLIDSKKQFCSYNMMLEKSKSLYNVEMITVFQRRNNVSSSSLNQPRNLKLKQPWFWVDKKNIFVVMLYCMRNCNLYINVQEINCISMSKL